MNNSTTNKTPANQTASLGSPLPRLVRLVAAALKTTDGSMMWDIIIDKPDIRTRIKDELTRYASDDHEAVTAVIRAIIGKHGERMEAAVDQEADNAMRTALDSLPNVIGQARRCQA